MESAKKTDCRASESPILCIKNCGFFGSATTMNMCSKCHKDTIMKQQSKLAAMNILSGGSSYNNERAAVSADATNVEPECIELKESPSKLLPDKNGETKAKEGPNRCTSCRKRVGLTGFKCKCGDLFCSIHRYADNHSCTFDYQAAGRDAIAKANPLVKAEKLDKI